MVIYNDQLSEKKRVVNPLVGRQADKSVELAIIRCASSRIGTAISPSILRERLIYSERESREHDY
jgi:hypothetical protein